MSGQTAPTDPRAGRSFPNADVTVPNQGSQLVVIEAEHVPLNWVVVLRMVPNYASDFVTQAAFNCGDETLSTWNATLPLPSGFTVLQARAYRRITATAADEEEGANDSSTADE